MKILHFLWALDNGGAENLAVDLANEQASDNEVTMLVVNSRVDDAVRARITPAVSFVCIGRPAASANPYWIARLLFVLHGLHPDVLHAHADNLAKLGVFISAPMVLTVHDTHINFTAAATRFALVCCISEAVLRDVSSRYPGLKLRQVNNGVMTSAIARCNRQRAATAIRGVQISRLVHDKKGQDLLISALAIVNAAPNQPKLSIDFIGDGPSLAHLIGLAANAGVAAYCHFVGAMPRSEVYQRLCTYDLLVQPSRYEGFGLTVAEGMAAGVPVVVSDIEGPMEIIANGAFGSFFKTSDVGALANALLEAISTLDTSATVERRKAARNHALAKYDLRHTAAQYCQIYREVISE